MAGTLFVVATPIGNLEDITARALRVLTEVALIAAEDTRRTSRLLAHYNIQTRTISVHEHNERQRAAGLIDKLLGGDSIALVSDAGTPLLSDPGAHLVAEAVRNKVPVESIPGPSALVAALSISGFSTVPFMFMGFPPTRSSERGAWFERLRHAGCTVVFFESPHRLLATMTDVARLSEDIELVVCREMTKLHGEVTRGKVSALLVELKATRGEYTIVANIGQWTETEESVCSGRPPEAVAILTEFYQMTEHDGLTRRQAISSLARKYRMTSRDVFTALDMARDMGVDLSG